MGHKTQLTLVGVTTFCAGFFLAKEMDKMAPLAEEVVVSASRGLMSTSPVVVTSNLRSATTTTDDNSNKQQGSSSSITTQFDRIFQKAYKDAVTTTPATTLTRNKFDINWWEQESGLTTQGGLRQEDRILLSQLYSNADSVFEYGLGESTYMANYVGVPRYAGIDSDPVWVDMARNQVAKHYRFYFADIGKTGRWGVPEDATLAKNVLDYQLEPLAVEQEPFDVYMVDGRYRLACALASFLHASARGGDATKTTVLIHDCHNLEGGGGQQGGGTLLKGDEGLTSEGREVYHKADHLLDLDTHSGARLCVYKRKPATTDEQIADLYMEVATTGKR